MLRFSVKLGWVFGLFMALGAGVFSNPVGAEEEADSILNARCGSCHAYEDGGLSRITGQRKTPEGWLMTIVRMGIMHGVEVPPEEKRFLVKYLSDTQGLAPSEAEPYRYILERQPSHVEDFPPEYFFMCARCHSGARGALQRRTKDEWLTHIHFHLGQWPTTEYQFYGRDRKWFEIATTETTDWLAENFPFESAAWNEWKGRETDVSGSWRWVARGPGVGFQHGVLTNSATGNDFYAVTSSQIMADGTVESLQGNAILYTGYEWRARLNSGSSQYLSVGTISEDANRSTGRFMVNGQDEVGLDYVAVRVRDGYSEILAVEPSYIKAGDEAAIAIHGTGLSGDVDLGLGVEVTDVVRANGSTIVVTARAAGDATLGARGISVGGTSSAADALVVYDQIAEIKVEPAYTIARVGGGGGTRPDQLALFDAVGYMDGDVRIGIMPATWTVEPFDEVAAELNDVGFAGVMDAGSGIYNPADAGMNPERPFETNNAGNLKVVGTVDDGGGAITGEGQLIVTVQRWNDPPIR